MIVEGLQYTREAIKYVEEKIHKEIYSDIPEYECILAIPGFGPDISSKVWVK